MPKSLPIESATCGGTCEGVEFIVEASLFDIGFALVTEVAIDGREVISCPTAVERANTLDQALDRGKEFAAQLITAGVEE